MNTTPAAPNDSFFFWISLEDRLDEAFYATSYELSLLGIKLLPVKIDQVSKLTALTTDGHVNVICSTRQGKQFLAFQKHVLPILGLLLRQERLSFFHFSSFRKLEVVSRGRAPKNYFFLTYPLNLTTLCAKLKRFHELRLNRAKVWPGGRRAKVPGLAA